MAGETTAATLARELLAALDDPKRYEWGESPWEHMGDAERDVRLLIAGILDMADALTAADKKRREQIEYEAALAAYRAGLGAGEWEAFVSEEDWQRYFEPSLVRPPGSGAA